MSNRKQRATLLTYSNQQLMLVFVFIILLPHETHTIPLKNGQIEAHTDAAATAAPQLCTHQSIAELIKTSPVIVKALGAHIFNADDVGVLSALAGNGATLPLDMTMSILITLTPETIYKGASLLKLSTGSDETTRANSGSDSASSTAEPAYLYEGQLNATLQPLACFDRNILKILPTELIAFGKLVTVEQPQLQQQQQQQQQQQHEQQLENVEHQLHVEKHLQQPKDILHISINGLHRWSPQFENHIWKHLGWDDWSDFTVCSVACGKGVQQRFRRCLLDDPMVNLNMNMQLNMVDDDDENANGDDDDDADDYVVDENEFGSEFENTFGNEKEVIGSVANDNDNADAANAALSESAADSNDKTNIVDDQITTTMSHANKLEKHTLKPSGSNIEITKLPATAINDKLNNRNKDQETLHKLPKTNALSKTTYVNATATTSTTTTAATTTTTTATTSTNAVSFIAATTMPTTSTMTTSGAAAVIDVNVIAQQQQQHDQLHYKEQQEHNLNTQWQASGSTASNTNRHNERAGSDAAADADAEATDIAGATNDVTSSAADDGADADNEPADVMRVFLDKSVKSAEHVAKGSAIRKHHQQQLKQTQEQKQKHRKKHKLAKSFSTMFCEGYNIEQRNCNTFECNDDINDLLKFYKKFPYPMEDTNGMPLAAATGNDDASNLAMPMTATATAKITTDVGIATTDVAADAARNVAFIASPQQSQIPQLQLTSSTPANMGFVHAWRSPLNFTIMTTLRVKNDTKTSATIFSIRNATHNLYLEACNEGLRLYLERDNSTEMLPVKFNLYDNSWHQVAISIQNGDFISVFVDCSWTNSFVVSKRLFSLPLDTDVEIGRGFNGELQQLLVLPGNQERLQCSNKRISINEVKRYIIDTFIDDYSN